MKTAVRISALSFTLAVAHLLPAFALAQAAAAPAEVPAAVAIPRPTPAEVTAITRSFENFKNSLPAADKAVLDRYPDVLAVRVPGPNTAVIPELSPRFVDKHNANKAVAAAGDIDVLFMGDSITDFWRNPEGAFAGKPVFDKYWGNLKVANFGIAGDTTQGVLYRLQNGEGEGFSPKAIMLMIGTNNTRANTAAEIAEGVGAIVLELQKDFPAAKILLLGIFPRSTPVDPVRAQIAEINTILSRLHDGDKVHYLDIGKVFLDANGNIPLDIMSDGLHPTTKGYELWASAVQEPLAALLR
ncbi:MAG: GDSL-type esterase/lipase family protein [Gammaproteobacteria bacterium]